MTSWEAFDEEIARWRDTGRSVELWWRDDDAADESVALDRLLAIRRKADVPLALAVVPAQATTALANRLMAEPAVDVLQHGYAHTNHAPPPDKKAELGPHRPAMMVLGELATGWMALERLFGAKPLPVLVPPWNRISPGLIPTLPEIGFTGLSTFGPRRRAEPIKGLRQVNTHLDLVDWKNGRGFIGEATALGSLVQTLGQARQTEAGAEPVGVLSHHLAMDEPGWDFLRSLLERTNTMSGLKMCAARSLFASQEARA
jgi:peptidoglycan/xylan/chitin deacetylase (PgdA/CDA1 family)